MSGIYLKGSNIASGTVRTQGRPERAIRNGFIGRANSSAVKRPQGLICGGEMYG
jgi:hypothetical protein